MDGVSDLRLVGGVLALLLPLVVANGVVAARGGYASASFWRSSREQKLEQIAGAKGVWLFVHAGWLLLLGVATAGIAGLAFLLASAGETALAGIGLGLFLPALVCWYLGVLLQGPPAAIAAERFLEDGVVAPWLDPLWTVVGWAEVAYVAGTAAAYVVFGVAMVDSAFPAVWAGWIAIVVGAVALAGAVLARAYVIFPELPLIVPFIVGVALLTS